MSSTTSPTWSPNRSSSPMRGVRSCATGCRRRPAPTPWKSSMKRANPKNSRAAMLSIAGICSSARKLGQTGQIAGALEVIEEALARTELTEERWCVADLLRIKGGILLLSKTAQSAVAAESCFLQGLDWARRQSALSWELRCATSLAQLWKHQGQTDKAREVLASAYEKFTEGFETADLKIANALLDS